MNIDTSQKRSCKKLTQKQKSSISQHSRRVIADRKQQATKATMVKNDSMLKPVRRSSRNAAKNGLDEGPLTELNNAPATKTKTTKKMAATPKMMAAPSTAPKKNSVALVKKKATAPAKKAPAPAKKNTVAPPKKMAAAPAKKAPAPVKKNTVAPPKKVAAAPAKKAPVPAMKDSPAPAKKAPAPAMKNYPAPSNQKAEKKMEKTVTIVLEDKDISDSSFSLDSVEELESKLHEMWKKRESTASNGSNRSAVSRDTQLSDDMQITQDPFAGLQDAFYNM
jgi:hypothetical protein